MTKQFVHLSFQDNLDGSSKAFKVHGLYESECGCASLGVIFLFIVVRRRRKGGTKRPMNGWLSHHGRRPRQLGTSLARLAVSSWKEEPHVMSGFVC